MSKLIVLISFFIPCLLPLDNVSSGVFFLVALWYIGIFLLLSLLISEKNYDIS